MSSMFARGKSSIRFTSAASACILPKALSNLVELGTLFSRLFSILICFAFRLQPSENSGTLSAGSRYSFGAQPLGNSGTVFGVAGWVTYLEKEKGAPACGRAGSETEDDDEGATLAQSNTEGLDGQ